MGRERKFAVVRAKLEPSYELSKKLSLSSTQAGVANIPRVHSQNICKSNKRNGKCHKNGEQVPDELDVTGFREYFLKL